MHRISVDDYTALETLCILVASAVLRDVDARDERKRPTDESRKV